MRGGPYPKARLLCFAVQPIPEQAGGMKDLDRCDRRRRIAGFEQNDRNIQHAVAAARG